MSFAVDVPNIDYDTPNDNTWLILASAEARRFTLYQYTAARMSGIKVVGYHGAIFPSADITVTIGLLFFSENAFELTDVSWAAYHDDKYYERGYYQNQPIHTNYYYMTAVHGINTSQLVGTIEQYIYCYPDLESAFIGEGILQDGKPVSIDYQGINTSLSGPKTVNWGEEVSIDVIPENGMVIQDPMQGKSISVYSENGYIPFVYANGKLTFTVPDAPNP